MAAIPLYDLYGELHSNALRDWLHWETIPSRSRKLGFTIGTHRHADLFQFLRLTAGTGRLMLSEGETALACGDVVVMPPRVAHGFHFSADVDGVVLTLFEQDLEMAGVDLPPAMVLPPHLAMASGLAAALDGLVAESARRDGFSDAAMRARIHLAVVAACRAGAATAASDRASHDDAAARDHALAFRALVEARFRTSRNVADYASRLGISPTHLGRVCRRVLGTTPLATIENRLARETRRMLVYSDCSIKELALELGYDDWAYFSRAARRWLGVSPRAFRRTARSAPAATRPGSHP